MRYRRRYLTIPNSVRGSILKLLPYTLFRLSASILKTIIAKSVLTSLATMILLQTIFQNSVHLHNGVRILTLFSLFYFFFPSLLIAVEESLHMGISIAKGKPHAIDKLVIVYLTTEQGYNILMISAGVRFRGKFEPATRIQIHGGAPLLIIIILLPLLIVGCSLLDIFSTNLLQYWIIILLFPAVSLLPLRSPFRTDGYVIMKVAGQMGYSIAEILKELLRGVYYGIRYLLYGFRISPDDETEAFRLLQAQRLEEALAKLESCLELNPDNPDIYNNIAWCFGELGREIDRAIGLARKAVEFNPEEATYYHTLGWCYFKKQDLKNAHRYLSRAVELEPSNPVFQKDLRKVSEVFSKRCGGYSIHNRI
ncbi:MAG TPA: tetratricopeptide repeat protein [bacterium (Candidatus Stahlbacteria)]|nr:tetratricopeptide repeat protein [Candidatus Stahlbacteria bacterium]